MKIIYMIPNFYETLKNNKENKIFLVRWRNHPEQAKIREQARHVLPASRSTLLNLTKQAQVITTQGPGVSTNSPRLTASGPLITVETNPHVECFVKQKRTPLRITISSPVRNCRQAWTAA